MRNVFIFPILIALSACSTSQNPVSSAYYPIPDGSKLVLKQALTIAPDAGRVYIQYGKVVTPNEKDNYHAHCWFLSWHVFESAQVIKPDTFVITRTQQHEDVVALQTPRQYAMNGLAFTHDGDGGPLALEYSTELSIHSDLQPAIRQFVCSHWERPDDARHLTVAEMQKVLGDIAEIQLNTSK